MNLTNRMERVRAGAIQRMADLKAERAEAENRELKTENRLLRDELSESRSERQRVLDLLDKAQFTVNEPRKRRFRLFRLLAAAGAIYAVGTSTGAFDRIRPWMDRMRGRMDEVASEGTDRASGAADKISDVVENAGRKMEQAGDRMEQDAKDMRS
ncbi:MAG: hypothetical protein ACRDH0_11980 [Actinomycetota bacterium]